MKRERGEKGRIADATWAKVPTPTWLFRDNYVDMQIEEPSEEFYSPDDFLKVFQKTKEEVGCSCQWIDTVTSKQWGCWVKEETRMKRKRIQGQKVSHREEVDNSAEALSSDQLVKRFAAEKSALFGEPADSSSKPMKSTHKTLGFQQLTYRRPTTREQ